MIWIDYTDPTPIYEQIVSKYKNLIVRNVLTPGEKMPSVRSLAMELSINPNTIQKAYAELERQGFNIGKIRGSASGDRGSRCGNICTDGLYQFPS